MQVHYFQHKNKVIFYRFFGIVLGFFAILSIFGIAVYPKLFVVWKNFLAQLEYRCGCTSHFSFQHHPWLMTSLIMLGLGLTFLIAYLSIRIVKIKWQTKKFVAKNLRTRKQSLSPKLHRAAHAANLQGRIIEINEQKPIIFCYGYFRPMICISTILAKKLSEAELQSVLQHEKHHLTNHDPIKLFIIKVTSKILFFVPGLKALAKQYFVFSELAADESATQNFQHKAPLAQALSKIIHWHQQFIAKKNLAVSFFDSVLPERINRLADATYIPAAKIVTPKFMLHTLALFTTVAAFGWYVNFSAAATARQDNGVCASAEPTANQCQMMKNNTCVMDATRTPHYCQN